VEHFSSFDGTDIAYLDVGRGEVVILLHGFASDHRGNWVAPGVTEALVRAGRRVIAPDARGHGRSGRPHDPAAYADGAMVRDVSALADHVGAERFDLAGYSMGALSAASVTLGDPRVRSLVLGGVGANWEGDQRPRHSEEVAAALEAEDPSSVTDPVGRAFRAFADSSGADRLALAALQRSARGPRAELGRLAVPTLVLTGERDTLVGPPGPLAERIPGARFRVLAGTHLSAVADPVFTSALVEFVTAAR
jgi:pimeloyl-ACP methyl ester carboxylesterase